MLSQLLTGSEIGTTFSTPVLLKHTINPPGLQFSQQEVGAMEGITQHNIVHLQIVQQASQQRLLICPFALIGAHSNIKHGAAGQAGNTDKSTNGKAQPILLAALLRVGGLIRSRIRHSDRTAINQANRTMTPPPLQGRLLINELSGKPG